MFKEILSNNALSIKDLSLGAGLARSTVADLINGKTSIEKMSAGNLFKISNYLGMNMQDLFIYSRLPEIIDIDLFIEEENKKIVESGLKIYIRELDDYNLVETAYKLNDRIRFQKYMSAVRDFYKYRRLQMPPRYIEYLAYLED